MTSADVARRDRAVELAGVAGGADQDEALAFDLGGNGFGFFLVLQVGGFELGAAAVEHLLVFFGGAQGLFLRQQEVAGVPVLDVDDVAHLAEAADTLEKNNLHVTCSLRFWFVRFALVRFQVLVFVGALPLAAR